MNETQFSLFSINLMVSIFANGIVLLSLFLIGLSPYAIDTTRIWVLLLLSIIGISSAFNCGKHWTLRRKK